MDIYFKEFDEYISIQKPQIQLKNIIWGGLYIDLNQDIKALNHKTKETVNVCLYPKQSDKVNSKIEGQAFDSSGKKVAELSGSWLDQISVTDLESGETEQLWKEIPLLDNAYMQYYYNRQSVLMNYKSPEMASHIAPTDSRFRGDLRLYEEGHIEQADAEKLKIEVKQRKTRKAVEEGLQPKHEPKFFREVEHPFVKNDDIDSHEPSPKFY